jgi:hypothetical protein
MTVAGESRRSFIKTSVALAGAASLMESVARIVFLGRKKRE